METRDVLALCAIVISVLALVVSITVAVKNARHNAIVRQHAAASAETAVLGQINSARGRLADVNLKLQDVYKGRLPSNLSADEKRYVNGLEGIYHEAIEVLLNTYELACGMYLDGKVDRVRFKRQYAEELKTLFKASEAIKKRLLDITSPFKAMRAVYEEWHNLETGNS